MEGAIFEDASCYYCMTARGESKVISSFTIEPTTRVETEDGELILGYANTDRGGRVPNLRFPLSSFHSKRDLIRQLPSADLQWTGSDNNVQGLLRVLARRDVPRRPGSNMLGDYKKGDHHVWLGPAGAIGKDGFMNPHPSCTSRAAARSTSASSTRTATRTRSSRSPRPSSGTCRREQAGGHPAHPRLVLRHTDEAALHGEGRHLPSTVRLGHAGLGQVERVHRHHVAAFGVRDAEPYSATETEFALLKLLSSTRSVPVFIDEYKPYDMQRQRLNTLHRYLRRLYRGEVEERGRPDLKVVSYQLQAPVCVAGETRPTESALLERIITSNPDKTTLAEKPAARATPTASCARWTCCCSRPGTSSSASGATSPPTSRWRAPWPRRCSGRKVPVRVVENLTAMLLGIHLFEEFAKHCGCELADDLGVEAAVHAVLDDVLETDHGVKNALDHFLEMLGVMAVQGSSSTRSTTCSTRGGSPCISRARTTPSGCTASASTTTARWST